MKHAERERERESFMVIDHRHHSARARCVKHGAVLHIDYSGAISNASMSALDALVLKNRYGTTSSIERIDSALTLFGPSIAFTRQHWPAWVPPAVVFVRPDQQPASIEFCSLLAKHGILRQTFLAHQTDLAQIWMEAAIQIAKSRSRRQS